MNYLAGLATIYEGISTRISAVTGSITLPLSACLPRLPGEIITLNFDVTNNLFVPQNHGRKGKVDTFAAIAINQILQ